MKQILQDLKTGATKVADIPCPRAGAGQVLIRTRASLVSGLADVAGARAVSLTASQVELRSDGGGIGARRKAATPELLRLLRAAAWSRALAGPRLQGRSAAMSSMIRRVTWKRALRRPWDPSPTKQRAGQNLTPIGTRRGM